jgi:hypothetical protein
VAGVIEGENELTLPFEKSKVNTLRELVELESLRSSLFRSEGAFGVLFAGGTFRI